MNTPKDIRDIRPIVSQCGIEPAPEWLELFELKNYRGPIEAIAIDVFDDAWRIKIEMLVLDALTGAPRQVFNVRTFTPYQYYNDVKHAFGHFLACALRETVMHELDECFLFDNEFVINPHPEIEGYGFGGSASQKGSQSRDHLRSVGHGNKKSFKGESPQDHKSRPGQDAESEGASSQPASNRQGHHS